MIGGVGDICGLNSPVHDSTGKTRPVELICMNYCVRISQRHPAARLISVQLLRKSQGHTSQIRDEWPESGTNGVAERDKRLALPQFQSGMQDVLSPGSRMVLTVGHDTVRREIRPECRPLPRHYRMVLFAAGTTGCGTPTVSKGPSGNLAYSENLSRHRAGGRNSIRLRRRARYPQPLPALCGRCSSASIPSFCFRSL